jgi:carnosine N-methyltransferase
VLQAFFFWWYNHWFIYLVVVPSQQQHLSFKMSMDPQEEAQEQAHWREVIRAFMHYEDFVSMDIAERQNHINRLPTKYVNSLPDSTFSKLNRVSDAAKCNQKFFNDLCDFQGYNFGPNTHKVAKDHGPAVPFSVMHRNQAVLHSLAREWAAEGREERQSTFDPLIEELLRVKPVGMENAYEQRVLVPGCGLSRLPLEIAARGYSCEANEFSMFMLTASHFILNGVFEKNKYGIFPWVDRVSNVVKIDDIVSPVQVPDASAIGLLEDSLYAGVDTSHLPYRKFSMAAGNFCEIYGGPDNKEAWDCVVTCFFVDTAPVVMEYIETIQHCLKPGGVWINLGPLLYHWWVLCVCVRVYVCACVYVMW